MPIDLPGHVSLLVNVGLLEEEVEALLSLDERVAGDDVDEVLQTLPPLLDEVVLEDAVVLAQERDLLDQGLAWKR